jgi:hypothetical protein
VRTLFVVAISLTLCGCGAHPETKRVEAAGVSLLIPHSWRVVDARTTLTSAEMHDLERQNPEFGAQLRLLENPRNPIALLAFAPSGELGSINVFRYLAEAAETPKTFAARVLLTNRRIPGFRVLAQRSVRVGGQAAVELEYVLPYRSRQHVVRFRTLQVLTIRRRREYAVTYAARGDMFARYRPLFRKSIRTLRID